MSETLTYYVALPFVKCDDGTAPGQAMECQSESQALIRAGAMSRDPANAGAIAFKRSGDPLTGDFSDAIIIRTFGDVPDRRCFTPDTQAGLDARISTLQSCARDGSPKGRDAESRVRDPRGSACDSPTGEAGRAYRCAD